MLVLFPAKPERSTIWAPDLAFAIRRDDAEIGRIELSGSPKRVGEASIRLGDRRFDCRVHITGRKQWTYVPSRWVMYAGEAELHAAVRESGTTFLMEGPDALRLRRPTFGGTFAIERVSDAARLGEIRWLRPRLVPKPEPQRILLDTSIELPETLEVFLLWIAAQDRGSD